MLRQISATGRVVEVVLAKDFARNLLQSLQDLSLSFTCSSYNPLDYERYAHLPKFRSSASLRS